MGFVRSKRFFKEVALSAGLAILATIFPFLFAASCAVRWIVWIIKWKDPRYGKLLRPIDTLFCEDFTISPPKTTIVTTLTVVGTVNLSLKEFRNLFQKNVIEANIPKWFFWKQKRYPELSQYVTSFCGVPVWKEEEDFQLCDHIKDKLVDGTLLEDPSLIHEQLLNEKFNKGKSPWEIILYRKANDTNNQDDQRIPSKVVIALRIHHTMADAKSVTKLFTECLGETKTTNNQDYSWNLSQCIATIPESIKYFVLSPIGCFSLSRKIFQLSVASHNHPWKTIDLDEPDSFDDSVPLITRIAAPIKLSSVKTVAKRQEVLVSSTIYSFISAVIAKYGASKDPTFIGITQEKKGHPKVFTNHVYPSYFFIPASADGFDNSSTSAIAHLQKCNDHIIKMKDDGIYKYFGFGTFMCGSLLDPLRKIIGVNYITPMVITNIAGSRDEIDIAGMKCTDWSMSVGTGIGVCGVIFLVYGYQDTLRVAVVAKDTVVTASTLELMAQEIGKQLEVLLGE